MRDPRKYIWPPSGWRGRRIAPWMACPISWQPAAVAPVFYGFRDYDAADGAPGPCRVFFPSLDGSPESAEILTTCGRYPLVLFAHGDCSEPEHYKKWLLLPATLARAGYVVAVPRLSGDAPWDADDEIRLLDALNAWLRGFQPVSLSTIVRRGAMRVATPLTRLRRRPVRVLLPGVWEHSPVLLPQPWMGVAGHSYGALKAARFAVEVGGVQAYASLSGAWLGWPPAVPSPLASMHVPSLFTWGEGGLTDFIAQWHPSPPVPQPRHQAVFRNGEHWDYLATTCDGGVRGPCQMTPTLAADLATMFFGCYLPPEKWINAGMGIDSSLIPQWPLPLSQEQEVFAGGWLQSFHDIGNSAGCSVTVTWDISPADSGSITVP